MHKLRDYILKIILFRKHYTFCLIICRCCCFHNLILNHNLIQFRMQFRKRTSTELERKHFKMVNDRVVNDITLEALYKPHTLTALGILCTCLIYKAFSSYVFCLNITRIYKQISCSNFLKLSFLSPSIPRTVAQQEILNGL